MAVAGANVVIVDYKVDDVVEALRDELCAMGVRAMICQCDISNEENVIRIMDDIKAEFGSVDIVVNNAGVLISRTMEEITYADWKRVTGVIMDGAFLMSKYAMPMMNKGGSVIMVSSNCAINGGGGSVAYPAAKSGMEGLARQIVIEYAGQGIRANIIQPCVIDTDMFRLRYPTDEDVANYGKRMPVGRVGTPADIANAAVFLASDEASYICGVTLQVDGGRTYYAKMN